MQNDDNAFVPYNVDYARKTIILNQLKRSNIDYALVKKLSSFGLNNNQLALALNIKYADFMNLIKTDEKLSNAIDAGKSELHVNILMGQLQMALPDPDNGYIGNASMLKHLGNVHLRQSDNVKVDVKEDITIKLKFGNTKLPDENGDDNNEKD